MVGLLSRHLRGYRVGPALDGKFTKIAFNFVYGIYVAKIFVFCTINTMHSAVPKTANASE